MQHLVCVNYISKSDYRLTLTSIINWLFSVFVPDKSFVFMYGKMLFYFTVQLLHKLSIHAADGPQKLLKVRKI